jgi:hypothetical protein
VNTQDNRIRGQQDFAIEDIPKGARIWSVIILPAAGYSLRQLLTFVVSAMASS